MERHLPIIEIMGTPFYLDVRRDELRQADNPTNRIPFNEITEDRSGYHLVFDTVTKNIPSGPIDKASPRCVRVTLQALMELDPLAVSEKYAIPLEVLSSQAETPKRITALVEPLKPQKHGKDTTCTEN